MPRGPLAFKESDVARAIRAARKGGFAHPCVQIGRDGRILIMDGPAAEELLPSGPASIDGAPDLDAELRDWLKDHGDG